MNITPSVDGFITGARFYKSTANTGTHSGSLWTATGQRLATATFTAETASGWQKVLFSQPVAVTAGQKYTVSYTAPNGHYASKDYQWASFGLTDPPLTVAGGFGSAPAGVYGSPGSFPDKQLRQRQLLRRRRVRHCGHLAPDGVRPVAAGRFLKRPAGHDSGGGILQGRHGVQCAADADGQRHGRARAPPATTPQRAKSPSPRRPASNSAPPTLRRSSAQRRAAVP